MEDGSDPSIPTTSEERKLRRKLSTHANDGQQTGRAVSETYQGRATL